MKIKFTLNTDVSKFDKDALSKKINSNEILNALNETVELERIFPFGSGHLVVFQAKNTDKNISNIIDQYLFNTKSKFQIYS